MSRFIAHGNMVRDIQGQIPTILTYNEEQLKEFLDGLNQLADKTVKAEEKIDRFRVFKYSDDSGKYGVSDDLAKYTVAFCDTSYDAESLCSLLNVMYMENIGLKEHISYLQSSICSAIKHSKTELEQKALKSVIEDYNEWVLGHNMADDE